MQRNLQRPSRRAQRGFTLLEMIVVLVIIGLIMGLVGPRLFGQADKAKVQTAGTQIKMHTMRLDIGRLPTAEDGLGLLVRKPADERTAKAWSGPYLDGELPTDPWGNPYQYSPSPSEVQPYTLYSLGADGQPGGEEFNEDVGHLPRN